MANQDGDDIDMSVDQNPQFESNKSRVDMATHELWTDLDSMMKGYHQSEAGPGDGNKQDNFLQRFQEFTNQRLDSQTLSSIRSLNSIKLDELKSESIVKYRCMVQDVFDPQFCLGKFKVVNTATGSSRVENGYFKDFPNIGTNENICFEDPENVTVERQSFYCVPIPGEADWVKEAYTRKDKDHVQASSSVEITRLKRGRDEETEHTSGHGLKSSRPEDSHTSEQMDCQTEKAEGKNVPSKTGGSTGMRGSSGVDLNMPLPHETGFPCIVRIYFPGIELKTTDTVEIIGVLSTDPQLAAVHDDDSVGEEFEQAELQAHEPPPSLVPRLHALVVRPLQHNNPILPPIASNPEFEKARTSLLQDALSLRLEVLSVLEHALLGDRLASEYLLSYLVARVYTRADVLPIGKLCLNLTGCLPTQRYPQLLNHLVSQLTTQSVYFEMSIEHTNSWKLVPKKDHTKNRLTAGMLQLSPGTCLVVDETALQQGTLDQNGLTNVKALADVINWQKVDYDFEWHPIPVHTDLNVLILSEGESLLPKDYLVPMKADGSVMDIPSHFEKLDSRLGPENIAKLRAYITACRLLDYSVPDELQKVIQDDFVESRKNSPQNMTVEDFQRLLSLVRIQTLTFGKECPTIEIWNKVRGMEDERKMRLSTMAPSRQTANNTQ